MLHINHLMITLLTYQCLRTAPNPKHKLVQPVWKTAWRFLRKLKMECHMSQQSHSYAWTKLQLKKMQPYVHCGTIHNSQDMEAA